MIRMDEIVSRLHSDEWYTPPEIIHKLGPFDLDPCSPINRPWDTAKKHFTIKDNGLLQTWEGFVWCNPPYGRQTEHWTRRCAIHNNGILLLSVTSKVGTGWFFDYVWNAAHSILFLRGRIKFHREDGSVSKSPLNPSFLIAYGDEAGERLIMYSILSKGKYIKL